MSGSVVRIIPRRFVHFDDLAPEDEAAVIVAERVDVSQCQAAETIVRIHALEFGPDGSGEIGVQVYSDGYTAKDPNVSPPFLAPVSGIEITPSDSAPSMKLHQLAGPFGSMLMLAVTFKQDETSSLALNAELSIDLVLKGA